MQALSTESDKPKGGDASVGLQGVASASLQKLPQMPNPAQVQLEHLRRMVITYGVLSLILLVTLVDSFGSCPWKRWYADVQRVDSCPGHNNSALDLYDPLVYSVLGRYSEMDSSQHVFKQEREPKRVLKPMVVTKRWAFFKDDQAAGPLEDDLGVLATADCEAGPSPHASGLPAAYPWNMSEPTCSVQGLHCRSRTGQLVPAAYSRLRILTELKVAGVDDIFWFAHCIAMVAAASLCFTKLTYVTLYRRRALAFQEVHKAIEAAWRHRARCLRILKVNHNHAVAFAEEHYFQASSVPLVKDSLSAGLVASLFSLLLGRATMFIGEYGPLDDDGSKDLEAALDTFQWHYRPLLAALGGGVAWIILACLYRRRTARRRLAELLPESGEYGYMILFHCLAEDETSDADVESVGVILYEGSGVIVRSSLQRSVELTRSVEGPCLEVSTARASAKNVQNLLEIWVADTGQCSPSIRFPVEEKHVQELEVWMRADPLCRRAFGDLNPLQRDERFSTFSD